MKIKLNTREFHKKLERLAKLARENKIRPVLSQVLLQAGTRLVIHATDLEQTAIVSMEAEIQEKGNVCVNPHIVLEYLALEEQENISIEFSDGLCKIGNMEFAAGDPEEFPNLKTIEGEGKIIKRNEFVRKIKSVIFAAGRNGNNIAVDVLRLDKDKIACTDSFRLVTDGYHIGLEASIPILSTVNLLNVLEGVTDEDIQVLKVENNMQITAGDYTYMTRLIDLAFPDVSGIINNINHTKKATVNILKIEKALKKANISASKNMEAKDSATFQFSKGKLEIRAISNSTKSKEKLQIEYEGEDLKVALNVRYMLDFVSRVNSNLVMEFSDNKSAFKLTELGNDEYKYVMMPLAIREE